MAGNHRPGSRVQRGIPNRNEATRVAWTGYNDFKAAPGFPAGYEKLEPYQQRNYERGRLRAAELKGILGYVPTWRCDQDFTAARNAAGVRYVLPAYAQLREYSDRRATQEASR